MVSESEPDITGQDGKALFADLPVGSYTLHEETTPANYQVLADHPFTISASQSSAERQIAATAIDIKESGTIKLIKVDSATGDALQGATFTLYDASGEQVVSNAAGPRTATSDAWGVSSSMTCPTATTS